MKTVTQSEYESYIESLENPETENYDVCGEPKVYHKINGEVVACKTGDVDIIYEIRQEFNE